MSAVAAATMIVICGFVWGGFLTLLARALRSDRGKRAASIGEDESR